MTCLFITLIELNRFPLCGKLQSRWLIPGRSENIKVNGLRFKVARFIKGHPIGGRSKVARMQGERLTSVYQVYSWFWRITKSKLVFIFDQELSWLPIWEEMLKTKGDLMKRTSLLDNDFVTGSSLVIVGFALFMILTLPMAYWTDSNLDFWFTYIAKHPVNCPFWLSWLATVFTNFFGIVGNIVLSLARLAV